MPSIPGVALPSQVEDVPKLAISEAPITPTLKADVVVAGSLAIDLSCDYTPFGDEPTQVAPVPHTSNPAIIGQSLGGVGHNVAVAANYVGSDVIFCSVVADDLSGRAALSTLEKKASAPLAFKSSKQRHPSAQHNTLRSTTSKRTF
jgi:Sugar kinases, ribokinase family